MLPSIDVNQSSTQVLIVCPTRELADQVAKEVRLQVRAIHNIKVLVLCGGTAIMPQIVSLKHPPHIVVGTPGRIEKLLLKGTLMGDNIKVWVLDEADRMLDMGFEPSIMSIVTKLPIQRQKCPDPSPDT